MKVEAMSSLASDIHVTYKSYFLIIIIYYVYMKYMDSFIHTHGTRRWRWEMCIQLSYIFYFATCKNISHIETFPPHDSICTAFGVNEIPCPWSSHLAFRCSFYRGDDKVKSDWAYREAREPVVSFRCNPATCWRGHCVQDHFSTHLCKRWKWSWCP